jgi:hypothetical protein
MNCWQTQPLRQFGKTAPQRIRLNELATALKTPTWYKANPMASQQMKTLATEDYRLNIVKEIS